MALTKITTGVLEGAIDTENLDPNAEPTALMKKWILDYSTPIGWLEPGFGQVRPLTGFDINDPESYFNKICMTNFKGSQEINEANFPALVPQLLIDKLIYREGEAEETSSFSGTSDGAGTITLDSNAANQALMNILVEWQADFATFTDWLTIDWESVTYNITALDSVALTIGIDGTPAGGAGNAEIYPHKVTTSSTVARIHSLSGKSFMGAGTNEVVPMGHRRDRMQRITGSGGITGNDGSIFTAASFDSIGSGAISYSAATTNRSIDITNRGARPGADILFDSADSPNARTSPATDTEGATHSPDVGVVIYMHAGPYVANP